MIWNKLHNHLKPSDLIYNDRPMLFRNIIDNPEKYLSWETIDECFTKPHNYDFEVIDKETGRKHEISFLRSPITGKPTPTKQYLVDSLNAGHSMSIRGGYSTHNANVNQFSAEIEDIFNMAAQVDIYLSGEPSRSFGVHEDTSTNFICQMYGKTRWKVFKNRCSDLLRLNKYSMTENDLEIAIDEVLSPGDVLYIPSRNFHIAIPNERRLSLSIVCLPVHYPHRARRIDRKSCKLHFP